MFSLVVKPTTIRVLLSLAVSKGWSIHQIGVQNAFLHGTHDEDWCQAYTKTADE